MKKEDKNFDSTATEPKTIAIIHPDLGIGGAERLIVDVALGLQDFKNHNVIIYTSHCDKSHAFEEVANDRITVIVYGDFLPRKIFGKFTILCATLRQIYLAIKILWLSSSNYDFYIIDSLAACLPILWIYNLLFKSKKQFSKILFYCHFPDFKLSENSNSLKKIYRIPFDYYEQLCYLFTNKVYVNSNFTKGIYLKSFPFLNRFESPTIIYPCIDETIHNIKELDLKIFEKTKGFKFFLSVNRFERKKNIELAIKSFAELENKESLKLIIAGGYDNLVSENVEYLEELKLLSKELKLEFEEFENYQDFINNDWDYTIQIYFLPNISTDLRNSLMKYTSLLLYTPSFEHFGIVPIEAMKYNTPVLAVNNGGPKESIIPFDGDYEGKILNKIEITNNEGTGYLKPIDPKIWSKFMFKIINEKGLKNNKNGEKIIGKLFTRKVLSESINNDIIELSKNKVNLKFQEFQRLFYFFIFMLLIPIFGAVYLFFRLN